MSRGGQQRRSRPVGRALRPAAAGAPRCDRVRRVDDRLVRGGRRQVARCRRSTRLDHTALDVAHAWPQFLPDGDTSCIRWSVPTTREPACTSRTSMHERAHGCWTRPRRPSYVAPGFLLYVQHDMLMAEPFDADRLRFGGRAVLLVPRSHRAIAGRRERHLRLARLLAFRAGHQQTTVDVGRPIGRAAGLARSPHVDVQLPRLS